MRQQVLALLFLGLTACTYALDLSHAFKSPTTEIEPRVLSLLNDLYAQVIYPPLNHVTTNLALLAAQVLAGIAANGIPAPNGRTLHPTEAELRGFWDDFWNNAIRPPIENALTGVSLLAAQVLAGIGTNGIDLSIGKRDLTVEDARIFDIINQALNDVFTQVIKQPLEDALTGGALLLAQLLAGIGTNGVNLSNLGGALGKRDLTVEDARIFDIINQALNDVFTQVIKQPLEDALTGGALLLAQLLAGIGTNGVNLSNLGGALGKRDLTVEDARIFDIINQALNDVFTQVIKQPLEDALTGGALMLAQLLAGIGTNGVNLSNLGGALGKREAEGRGPIIDNLLDHATGLLITQVKPAVESALNAAALHLAGVLANIAEIGLGRR